MLDGVREISQSGELLELYITCYRNRYKVAPILNQGVDQTTARDLIRNHGYHKACELIEAFLLSDYWTFLQKKHPLQALVRDINIVNVSVEAVRRRKDSTASAQRLRIRCYRICDTPRCPNHSVPWEGLPQQLHLPVFCANCAQSRTESLLPHTNNAPSSPPEAYNPESHDRIQRLKVPRFT